MKNKLILSIGSILILIAIVWFFPNNSDSAREIQKAWNDQPGNRGEMSYETAIELSKRFNNLDNAKSKKNMTIENIKNNEIENEWQEKINKIDKIISEIAIYRNTFMKEINETNISDYYSKENMLSRISAQRRDHVRPLIATLNIITELLNDILLKINEWNRSHNNNIPPKAKESAQKIISM